MVESRSRVTARRRTDGLARTCCRTNHGDRAFRASPDRPVWVACRPSAGTWRRRHAHAPTTRHAAVTGPRRGCGGPVVAAQGGALGRVACNVSPNMTKGPPHARGDLHV